MNLYTIVLWEKLKTAFIRDLSLYVGAVFGDSTRILMMWKGTQQHLIVQTVENKLFYHLSHSVASSIVLEAYWNIHDGHLGMWAVLTMRVQWKTVWHLGGRRKGILGREPQIVFWGLKCSALHLVSNYCCDHWVNEWNFFTVRIFSKINIYQSLKSQLIRKQKQIRIWEAGCLHGTCFF